MTLGSPGRALRWLAPYAAVALVAAPLAYWQIFSSFQPYDDEGYLLISLQSFLHGGTLYSDVYTQYGPFYYELFGALFKLAGRDVSTNSGRFIVVAIWLAASGLLGLAMHRLTGRLLIGIGSQIVGFSALGVLVLEPMHPVSLTCLLTVALVATVVWTADRPRVAAAVLAGAVLAALTLTKINIGALAVAAGAYAAVATVPALQRLPWLRASVIAAFIAMPLVLMRSDLNHQWAQDFAFVILAGAGALTIVTAGSSAAAGDRAPWDRGVLRALALAFSAAGALIIVVILALGTPVSDLFDGVIAEPLRLSDAFVLPMPIAHESTDWALAALAAALVVRWRPAGDRGPSPWPGILRIVAGVAIWLSVTTTWPLSVPPGQGRLVPGVLLAWLAAVPPSGTVVSPAGRFLRLFLPALAVAEALQAYPVAGTQITAGALLALPVGALVIADGWAALERWSALVPGREWARQACVAVAVAVVAKFAVSILVRPLQDARATYRNQAALPFDGATRVHLPEQTAKDLAHLVTLVRTRCSTFLTYPGMNSFYLWAYRKPPTGLNTTDWMKLLDDDQQQRIVDAVRGEPRLCVIRHRPTLEYWTGGSGPPRTGLVTFIERNFTPQETVGEYDFMTPGPPNR